MILRGGVVRALRIGMEVKEVGEGEGEGNSKEVDRVGIRTTIIIIIMQVEEEVGDEILGKLRCSRVCAEKRTDFEVEFWERFSQVTCYKCGQMGHFANKYVLRFTLPCDHSQLVRVELTRVSSFNFLSRIVAQIQWL